MYIKRGLKKIYSESNCISISIQQTGNVILNYAKNNKIASRDKKYLRINLTKYFSQQENLIPRGEFNE